jgi:hypothetical protein
VSATLLGWVLRTTHGYANRNQEISLRTTRVELTNRNGKTDSPQQAAHWTAAFYPDGVVGAIKPFHPENASNWRISLVYASKC